jgi:hypothetical protein
MSKLKKHTLDFDEEIDFECIGITSHHRDYRLAWNINMTLNIQLKLSDKDLMVYRQQKKKESSNLAFPRYTFYDELNRLCYHLIENKFSGNTLITEYPMIDFFLFIDKRNVLNLKKIGEKLKKNNSILAVFPMDVDAIASFQDIIFEEEIVTLQKNSWLEQNKLK